MQGNQRTPGPWHVTERSVFEPDGDIQIAYHPGGQQAISQGLARVTWQSFGKAPSMADARLIAKAPELVEALRDYIGAAEELISKITGLYEARVAERYWNTKNRAQALLAEIDG